MKAGITSFAENSLATLLSLGKIAVSPKRRGNPIRNDSGQEECVILGNGPTLTGTLEKHTSFLEGKYLIGVNDFALTALFETLRPSGYVLSAPDYWEDGILPEWVDRRIRLFTALKEKTDWPLHLFIPVASRKVKFWQDMLKENSHIRISYYSNTPVEGFTGFLHLALDRQWGLPRAHNVLGHSVSLALFMRFKKIYLMGADHSWLKDIWVDEDNTVYMELKHFYDKGQTRPLPIFPTTTKKRKLYDILYKLTNTFHSYYIFDRYARKRGIAIINVTPGSYIDAFPRLNLDTLSGTGI